jgi:aryl-alcohol dehydrogenase-like predicted oxidoreductase
MSNDPRFFSRREVVQAGVFAGVGASLSSISNIVMASDKPPAVITRSIPSTGEKIPVMGIGTNRFGTSDYDEVKAVLNRMHEIGGRVVDTAAMYGRSEEVIGKALGELNLRDKMFIATKFNAAGVGFASSPGAASGPASDPVAGIDSFERSLERLQMKKVDLLFAHFIGSVEPLMPVMIDLKKKGRARYIGFTSIQDGQYKYVLDYMRKYPIDFLQIDYSLGDRSAADEILPLAIERKIAIMLAVPFGGGRNLLFNKVGDRQVPKWAEEFGATTWSDFFLKYAISHPAVTCAIPGSSKVQHLEENQKAGLGLLPDAAMRKRIEEFWDKG